MSDSDSPPDREETNRQRFIADAMLGRLARWLRFLGLDVLYYQDISDAGLIKIAKEQERTILTRDTRLVLIKGIGHFLLITADEPFKQLLEVVRVFHLKGFYSTGRCVKCNGQLAEIKDKSGLSDEVPEYIYLNTDLFFRCVECDKIYWEGSHLKRFRETVNSILSGGMPDKESA